MWKCFAQQQHMEKVIEFTFHLYKYVPFAVQIYHTFTLTPISRHQFRHTRGILEFPTYNVTVP